ncbi:hypothetical protein [Nitratireductor sp. CH_MIT9313-5]|uniref:hypothetical protein n=1 Tax=Nitratireductor sp. CH_MIT9313-5 TaxID=3107764 RepID=UPI003008BECB
MTVSTSLAGIVQPPSTTLLATTAKTDVFTASDKYVQKVVSVAVANEDTSSAILVTLHWHDGSSDHVFWVKEIAAKSTEIVSDIPLSLSSRVATQKIKATAGIANKVSVTVISVADYAAQGGGGRI